MNIVKPILSTFYHGYYEIPGYSKYVINPMGRVINQERNTELQGSFNPAGYCNFRLTADNGITLTWGRHRLLGYVFKHPGVSVDNLVINHKNGIKGDDRLENLEWTTQIGNVEHAGWNGLTEKCIPVAVRDIDTGEVDVFPSIVTCAENFGMTKDAVNWRLKAGERRVFPERKQYRPANISTPWVIPENTGIALLQNGTSKPVLVRDVFTGSVRCFPRVTELAAFIGISVPTLSGWLRLTGQPVLPGFVQVKWFDDLTPWRIPSDPYIEHERATGQKSVVVVDSVSGYMEIFSSAVTCAQAKNLKTTALNYRLRSKGKTIFSDNCTYSYYSDHFNY